jgi:hypothetical protein
MMRAKRTANRGNSAADLCALWAVSTVFMVFLSPMFAIGFAAICFVFSIPQVFSEVSGHRAVGARRRCTTIRRIPLKIDPEVAQVFKERSGFDQQVLKSLSEREFRRVLWLTVPLTEAASSERTLEQS